MNILKRIELLEKTYLERDKTVFSDNEKIKKLESRIEQLTDIIENKLGFYIP